MRAYDAGRLALLATLWSLQFLFMRVAVPVFGSPLVAGNSVSGEIVRHSRSDKIRIFKKKRRKKYRRRGNHRQWFTEVRLTGFGSQG